MDATTAYGEAAWYSREPTIPLSYFIGMREIISMREECCLAQGRDFQPANFHARLLSSGTLPIPLIKTFMLGTNQ